MRRGLLLCCMLLSAISTWAQVIGEITWTNGFMEDNYVANSPRVELGFVAVPENYHQPDGRMLQIAFAIIKSQALEAKADPVIIFKGGWGDTSLDLIPYYLDHFLGYQRDIILYDYRGSGYSEPKMCEWLAPQIFDNILADQSNKVMEDKQIALFNQCLDSLEMAEIDFNQYGSYNKARDAAVLAEYLGYEQYNLFATSYGTRALQCFLEVANVKVRSVVMDSPCPVAFPVNSTLLQDYARSLNKVLDDCAKDPACSKAYPNLRSRYLDFLNSLEDKPLKVKLPKSKVAHLNREKINAVVHQMLYDEERIAQVPFLLDKIIRRKQPYLKYIMRDMEDVVLENFNALGLINYVYDHKPLQEESRNLYREGLLYYADYHIFDGFRAFFLQDQRFESDSLELIPIKSNIPSLILSGDYDPITPPSYAKTLLPHFKNHQFFLFPKVGHGVSNNDCGQVLVQSFIDRLQDLSADPCLKQLANQSIPFYHQ